MTYDPFAGGSFRFARRSLQAADSARGRVFPVEIWEQHGTGDAPLVIYSHHSGGGAGTASYLCDHLASHGYSVAAMTHSEVIAPELARPNGETEEQKRARWDALIASRVPDVLFLLDYLQARGPLGIAGHSFGGWTALAAADVEPRIGAVVALAPGGASNPRPGVLPLNRPFQLAREVPTMLLAAENDTSLPLSGMYEIFENIPGAKRMLVLRRADHLHFIDDAERMHEAIRNMDLPAELAWLKEEMRPMAELCPAEEAHSFVRGLTLAHLDAHLRGIDEAQRYLEKNLMTELRGRGIDAFIWTPA